MDTYYWNADWVPKPNEEWNNIVEQFINEEHWIMDGNYSRTMDIRINKADLIIFLDMPRLLCIYRIIKRRIIYHKKSRPDMNQECPEKLDWDFVKWVWNYRKKGRVNTIKKLEQIKGRKEVVILRTRKEMDEFIGKVEKEGAGLG
ncbi:topology modulation protein [compost metagenome]